MNLQGVFDLQFSMFTLMGMGYYLRRRNMITAEGRKVLTELLMNIFLPCNIINAFCISFEKEVLISAAQIFILSTILQLFCTFLSAMLYRKIERNKRVVLQYGTVCSNAGLLGNPISEGLFGAIGLLYASIYLIPQRIVMWSAGVSYFTESPNKKDVVKRVIKHPCIIAVELGIILMLTGGRLSGFLQKSVISLGNCSNAVTMLFLGCVLADSGIKELDWKLIMFYSILRLLGIPLAVLAGCSVFRVGGIAAALSTVLAAMPMGSTTAILASQYDGDEVFATQCVVITTILSMLLLLGWCVVLKGIVG